MANIKKIEGKTGISYKITVFSGVDTQGRQVRHYRTWKPEPGMTARQMEKAVQRAAMDFERELELGYQADNRQTFAEYAEYVLSLKERAGLKPKTLFEYRSQLVRINAAIGHMKLQDIRPQHLNSFYKNLAEEGVRKSGYRATAVADLAAILKEKKWTREKLATVAGISATTVTTACRREKIRGDKAEAIAAALGQPVDKLFSLEQDTTPLAAKSLLAHHRLIHTILHEAEREMLVVYNAADKATPPKDVKKDPNYFQPEQIAEILEALDSEPLKWRLITHLLIVTGCRRGEIMGLKWEKIDFDANQIRIDSALKYLPDVGVYEGDTKTGNTRTLYLPEETMQLLRQHRRDWLELRLKNGDRWNDTNYLFVQDDGSPMNPESIGSWLSKFSARHGLPHINPHAFRHTAASVLIANGTDVVTVSKQLGHQKISTTEDFYSHLIEKNKKQATDCIAATLLRRKKA